ncbi:MAG: glycoside hydrolase family 3 C-terminal domain-containing protein [Rhizomicrobium sp.]
MPSIIRANAQFVWGKPKREPRNSRLRWTGFITPKESGAFRFGFAGDTPFRITVGKEKIVDAWDSFDPQKTGTISLQAGHTYALTVEARQNGDRGDQHLMWERPAHNAQAALTAARKADLTVFVGGLSPHLEGEEMTVHAPGFAGGDRTSLDLPAAQEKLLERLGSLRKPVILVLMNGSAISTNWADQHIPAIVEAWYPGGEGGHAVAALLAGDFSPAGRLPVTFYKSAEQLPPFKSYAMTGRTYRYFTGTPLYPFGYGLSYTQFSYGPITLDHDSVVTGGSVHAFVDVTNTGSRDGDEVVQLYVSHPIAGAPIRALQGFKRIPLKAGETRKVDFVLDERAMSMVDASGKRAVSPGAVTLWIGGGQPTTRDGLPPAAGTSASFTVTGQKKISD